MLDLDLRAFLVASGVPYARASGATVAGALAATGSGGGGGDVAAPVPAAVDEARRGAEAEALFFAELAMTEGAPFACPLFGDGGGASGGSAVDAGSGAAGAERWCSMRRADELKRQLLLAGLLTRVHGPQQLLRGHEALLRARIAAAAGGVETAGAGATAAGGAAV